MRKKSIEKSLLNLHFKGFGAISRSDSNRALQTVHFGIGEVPKCPTDNRFMKILLFFAILVTFFVFFCKKRISSCRSRWNKLKMTDLEKSMRTDIGKKQFDCTSSEWRKDFAQKCKFGTNFFSTLDFIWKSHSLQFLVYALPIRFWQVLMKLKNPKVQILIVFSKPFNLYGKAIDFNFWAVPSL